MIQTLTEILTASERRELSALESVIQDAANRQMALAKALLSIRDRRLYREHHDTFEAYCHVRWNCSAEQGRRLCKWAEVLDNVGKAIPPIGGFLQRESHARPLAMLTPPQQRQAARELAKLPAATAADVAAVCDRVSRTPTQGNGPAVEPMARLQGLRSPVPWFGGKGRLAQRIIELFPPHDCYCEGFFGGGAVLFAKAPAKNEIAIDVNGDVVNFFSVLRDRPEEL